MHPDHHTGNGVDRTKISCIFGENPISGGQTRGTTMKDKKIKKNTKDVGLSPGFHPRKMVRVHTQKAGLQLQQFKNPDPNHVNKNPGTFAQLRRGIRHEIGRQSRSRSLCMQGSCTGESKVAKHDADVRTCCPTVRPAPPPPQWGQTQGPPLDVGGHGARLLL